MFFSTAHTRRVLKTVVVTAVLMLLTACSPQKRFDNTLAEAEQLVERNADSTMLLLSTITDVAVRGNAQSQALYGLLLTQAKYKLYQDKPDSLLPVIAASEHVFRKLKDKSHLCRTIYYHAMMLYKLDNHGDATKKLKEAAMMAEQQHDTIQIANCYENLTMINYRARANTLMLEYARKFMEVALDMNDLERVVRGYNHLYMAYFRLGLSDSCASIINKIQPKIKQSNINTQATVYNNIGQFLRSNGNYREAENYFNKCLELSPQFYHAFYGLGEVFSELGDEQKALLMWNNALNTNDSTLRLSIREAMLKSFFKGTDKQPYKDAFDEFISLHDSAYSSSERKEIVEIQSLYDKKEIEASFFKSLSICFLLIIVLALFSFIVWLYYFKREKVFVSALELSDIQLERYKKELDKLYEHDASRQIELDNTNALAQVYKQKAEDLTIQEQEKKEKIEQLTASIHAMKKAMNIRLGKGKEVYDSIISGGILSSKDPENESCLIEYYSVIKYQQYQSWQTQYEKLSARLITYLILQDLNKSDAEIAKILCVQASTVRSIVSRLGHKKRINKNKG